MTRNSTSLVLLALGLAACDRSEGGATTGRSEQVIASATSPPPAPEAAPSPHASASSVRRGRLCDGDGNARGRALSKVSVSHVEAAAAPRLDGAALAPRGQWTWINFWAAWCGPCKEEMPRMLAWQDSLAKANTPVRFAFLSLDDDRRQLEQFLEAQPPAGLKASFWLPEGPTRASWLQGLRMKSSPELPEQALVDPSGRVRCFIEGAVEDGDYAEVAGLVAR